MPLPIDRIQLLMIVVPLVMFIVVLEMVRRQELREDYSLLWLGTFGAMLVLSLFPNTILTWVSDLMGIFYPPTALFVIGFGLLLAVMLQFSSVLTKLARENKQAAQHIALMGTRIEELEREIERLRGE